MGRPKKKVDERLIMQLIGQGISLRKVSQNYNKQYPDDKISKDTVSRFLSQNCLKTISRRKDKEKETVSKLSQNSSPRKCLKTQQKSSDVLITTNNKTASTPPTNLSKAEAYGEFEPAHHYLFTIKYKGTVTEGIQYYAGNKKNPYTFRKIHRRKVVFDVRPKTISIWIKKNALKADDNPDKINAEARRIAIQALGELSERNKIGFDKSSFKAYYEPIHTNPNTKPHFPAKSIRLGKVDRQIKESMEKEEILLGDKSHQDQIEFIGSKGNIRAKNLVWMLDKFPEQFVQVAGVMEVYTKQIKTHLSVMEEMKELQKKQGETQDDTQKALKELSEAIKKLTKVVG